MSSDITSHTFGAPCRAPHTRVIPQEADTGTVHFKNSCCCSVDLTIQREVLIEGLLSLTIQIPPINLKLSADKHSTLGWVESKTMTQKRVSQMRGKKRSMVRGMVEVLRLGLEVHSFSHSFPSFSYSFLQT